MDRRDHIPGWYVFNETNGHYLRGPFVHQESAAAVRHEMESHRPSADWNLQVIELPGTRDRAAERCAATGEGS